MIRRLLLVGLLALPLSLSACGKKSETNVNKTHAVYLIRHAEKEKGDNPGLTEAGQARAQALVDKLSDKDITHIYSTDYRRTMETATPLSKSLDLEITIYDPDDLSGLAEKIKAKSGNYVVVGHSNTTPVLASLISDKPMDFMEEDEFDRFITLELDASGKTVDWDVSTYRVNE